MSRPDGPDRPDVGAAVRRALQEVLGAGPAGPAEPVPDTALLREDLGADSLAVLEVVERLQAALPGLRVDDGEVDGLRTVGDLLDRAGAP